MGLSIYFRSVDTMHPALAYEINQHAQRLISQFSWLDCDVQQAKQGKDGRLVGAISPDFPILDQADDSLLGDSGGLMTLVGILSELSRLHAVDWEFTHDYEPDVVGRIVEGVVEPELIEELESVIDIGNLFGDFIDEEDSWSDVYEATNEWESDPKPRLMIEDDAPHVLKFPGIE